jgi:hypothetical protein
MRFLPTLLLTQAAFTPAEPSLTRVWEQLPMVGVVVLLWLWDSRRRAAQDEARDKRENARDEQYAALVQQVVKVVTDNATASAGLQQVISSRPCIARTK